MKTNINPLCLNPLLMGMFMQAKLPIPVRFVTDDFGSLIAVPK